MALSGHARSFRRGPLSEAKRTHPDRPPTSQFDPLRTLGLDGRISRGAEYSRHLLGLEAELTCTQGRSRTAAISAP